MEAVGRSLPASIPKVRPCEHAHAGRVGCRVFSDALPVPIFVPFWSGGDAAGALCRQSAGADC